MQNVLLVIQFFIAIALIGVILLQRTAQDGGGLTGGGSTMGGLFTARGSANILTRATTVLAALFIINSLTLGAMASSHHQVSSVLDQIAPVAPAASDTKPSEAPAPAQAPAAPQVPLAQ